MRCCLSCAFCLFVVLSLSLVCAATVLLLGCSSYASAAYVEEYYGRSEEVAAACASRTEWSRAASGWKSGECLQDSSSTSYQLTCTVDGIATMKYYYSKTVRPKVTT